MFLVFAAAIYFIAPPGVDTIRLPQAAPGNEVIIRKVNNINPLFIVPSAGDALEGLPSQYILSGTNDRIILICQIRGAWWLAGGANLPISLTTDVTGILPVVNGGTGVSVASDDNVLVGDGINWVPTGLPNTFGTQYVLGYRGGSNVFYMEGVYKDIQEESVGLTRRSTLNVLGTAVVCVDDAANAATVCTFTIPPDAKTLPLRQGLPIPFCNNVLHANWRGTNCRTR